MIQLEKETNNTWRWIATTLACILLTIMGSYWTFGRQTETDIALLKTSATTTAATLQRVTDVLIELRTQNAAQEARLKALEDRQ